MVNLLILCKSYLTLPWLLGSPSGALPPCSCKKGRFSIWYLTFRMIPFCFCHPLFYPTLLILACTPSSHTRISCFAFPLRGWVAHYGIPPVLVCTVFSFGFLISRLGSCQWYTSFPVLELVLPFVCSYSYILMLLHEGKYSHLTSSLSDPSLWVFCTCCLPPVFCNMLIFHGQNFVILLHTVLSLIFNSTIL